MKYKKCKGVLGKDGKPYLTKAVFVVRGEWQVPAPYTPLTILQAFGDREVTKIIIIDENNDEHTLTK